ncbi:helix-turn-helix domain-containing protein [Methylotenera sp.]|uniref:helix-turn-helix domain-containing protein n=1 Tax=Methylotenera sp. TaxID=2051956 RepID=UPI0027319BEE|nr:helix-turn-helix domain-containing protein [Methylotenera sp.]MDP2230420.1 DUF4115 domain-containing protein [Methylotenera sp.]MDP3141371.1 DUF4115 domain-containing protein [Methylotenera sp.]
MTDEVTNNPSETGPASFSPMGEVLASARNAKKLEVKDVSNNLRLSIKQIEALENNDFDGLPQPMITRGFIRNYARLLELDAEPLLESYRARVPEVLPSALNVQTTSHRILLSRNSQPKLKFSLVIALALLMLLAWFLYTNFIPKIVIEPAEIITESSGNSSNTETVALPEVALPAAERLPESSAIASADVEKSEDVNTTAPNTPQVDQIATGTEVATQGIQLPKEATVDANTLKENAARTLQVPATSQTATVVQVTEADSAKSGLKVDNSIVGIKSVSISVLEQTWVRISDKTGAVVYEKILQPNSEDGFNGLPPFKVLIGNAKGTKLTFSGQPVDLTDKIKNNVARVTLE